MSKFQTGYSLLYKSIFMGRGLRNRENDHCLIFRPLTIFFFKPRNRTQSFFPFSSSILLSILTITVGVFIASAGDLEYDGHAYLMGGLSVFAQGGYLTLVQKASEVHKLSAVEMIHVNAFNTLPFFVVMSLVMSEPAAIFASTVTSGRLAVKLAGTVRILDLV